MLVGEKKGWTRRDPRTYWSVGSVSCGYAWNARDHKFVHLWRAGTRRSEQRAIDGRRTVSPGKARARAFLNVHGSKGDVVVWGRRRWWLQNCRDATRVLRCPIPGQ